MLLFDIGFVSAWVDQKSRGELSGADHASEPPRPGGPQAPGLPPGSGIQTSQYTQVVAFFLFLINLPM